MAGVDEAQERTQYQPLLGVGESAPTTERALVDAMIDRQMDGLILSASRIASGELQKIADFAPTVAIGLHLPNATNFDTVNNDD